MAQILQQAALELPLEEGLILSDVAEQIISAGCRKVELKVYGAEPAVVNEAVELFTKALCEVVTTLPSAMLHLADEFCGETIWRAESEKELQTLLEHGVKAVEAVWDGNEVWDINAALDRCRAQGVCAKFGCTPAFAKADDEILHELCGREDLPFPGGKGCMEFIDGCLIKCNGDVWSCAGLEMVLGNIRSLDLSVMLQNSSMFNFFHNWRENIKKECRSCEKFGSCAGCRGRAYWRNGDFLGSDTGCVRVDAAKVDRLPSSEPAKYMPHRHPMLMATTLLEVSDNYCRAESVIREDNPFLLPDGRLHAGALVEIGAQSMAFLDTFLHAGRPMQGMLVEIQSFEYTGFPVYSGCKIYCFGRKIYEMPPWNIGRFELYNGSADGELIAAGEIKVCQSQ